MAVRLGYKNIYRFAEGIPEWKKMGLPVTEKNLSDLLSAQQKDTWRFAFESGLFLTLIGVFFGGIALNLTPCVYPLIPVTASYFGGRSGDKRQGYLLIHGVLYILGISIMNSTLGVTAALTGKLMGSLLQHPAVLIFVSSVFLLMALNFFGLWELRIPAFLSPIISKSHTGYAGSLFMGLTLGIVAAPCIGPFIIGLLTMVAQKGDPLFGFLIFFTLSLGLGLPLFILSIFAGNLSKLPRSGEWLLWIRKFFGWIMLAMAVYFIKPVFPWRDLGTYILVIVIFASGVYLGFLNKIGQTLRTFVFIKRITGIVAIALSLVLVLSLLLQGPGVSWKSYSQLNLKEAETSGKPTIIDFYADWCTPCRNLERKTFHDRRVVKESEKFLMIKVDLTKKGDLDPVQLLDKYHVKGVPTVIFLDSRGNEIKELRILDFMPAEEFFLRMQRVLRE
ncbi:MAG: thioredoxin family protein [Nitrospirota bacterium]|nr:thioredoxin family protein [Nitrospirota bacterium]MDH5767478.1 thioredoxin family protein [Nitrospirota bacterium]